MDWKSHINFTYGSYMLHIPPEIFDAPEEGYLTFCPILLMDCKKIAQYWGQVQGNAIKKAKHIPTMEYLEL